MRGKGTFSWVFRSKSINQPQRNTSEARSGFLAGTVITKATGWLCIFCSCWRLSQNFGAAQVQPWLAWVCRSWKSGRREEGKGAGRERAQLSSPCCGSLPVAHMMNGFLQISGLPILDVSTGKDQTNLERGCVCEIYVACEIYVGVAISWALSWCPLEITPCCAFTFPLPLEGRIPISCDLHDF